MILILAPWIVGFSNASNRWAVYVPVALGVMVIIYSVLTDYELGAVRVIPMPAHLGIDIFSGLLLAASPWLFGFLNQVYLPHLAFFILEIGAGVMTHTVPNTAAIGYADGGQHGTPTHPAM